MASARNTEGAALAHLGRFEEAEQLLLSSRAGLANSPIPDLPFKAKQRLEYLYKAWGKLAKAEELRAAK
jgi:hypothetical protein